MIETKRLICTSCGNETEFKINLYPTISCGKCNVVINPTIIYLGEHQDSYLSMYEYAKKNEDIFREVFRDLQSILCNDEFPNVFSKLDPEMSVDDIFEKGNLWKMLRVQIYEKGIIVQYGNFENRDVLEFTYMIESKNNVKRLFRKRVRL